MVAESRRSQVRSLGPTVLLLHAPRHVQPLAQESDLSHYFRDSRLPDAYFKIEYHGCVGEDPNYDAVHSRLVEHLLPPHAQPLRATRTIATVYAQLRALCDRFGGALPDQVAVKSFPDEVCTCSSSCNACLARYVLPTGHECEHRADRNCRMVLPSQIVNTIVAVLTYCVFSDGQARECVKFM